MLKKLNQRSLDISNTTTDFDEILERVLDFQKNNEVRIPDTIGECEITRCLRGEGL